VRHFTGIFAGELALSIGLPEGTSRFEVVAGGPLLGGSLVLCGGLYPCGDGVLSPSRVRGSRFRGNEAIVTQRWRLRFRYMNSAINERRKDVSHSAIFFRGCGCNLQASGIERCAVRRSVVVGRTRSLPFLFLCDADAPWSGSIGWKQRRTHGGGQEFESSTCGVEMPACGGFSFSGVGRDTPRNARHLNLPAWQAPAGPATSGQGRKRRSGGARCAPAFTG